MATTKACAICEQPFEAQRSTAKYCSDRCRQRSRRKATPEEAEEIEPSLPWIVELTKKELEEAGKLETVLGAQAMTLALRMTYMVDTGSAIAAVSRELDRVMLRVRGGAASEEDELTAARRRRDEKRRQATASAGKA